MRLSRFRRLLSPVVLAVTVIGVGGACSDHGDSPSSPAGRSATAPTIPDPRSAPVGEGPVVNLPARTPEFPPNSGLTIEQLHRQGKAHVVN